MKRSLKHSVIMVNIETKPHINFTDDGITTPFYEGDNVICCIGEKERYTGKIIAIGNWKETEDSELYEVICIDTSKSARSYSSEIIKTNDITYICKNLLAEEVNPPMSKEEMDKKTYCGMLVGLGYNRSKAEKLWEKAQKTMKTYDIPVTKMIACTVYSLKNDCSITVPLKMICGIDVEEKEETLSDMEHTVMKKIVTNSIGLVLVVLGCALTGLADCIDNLDKAE